MGKFSGDKGKRGERELSAKLRELGFAGAYRSQQFCGSADSADVAGVPGVHPEVKRCERLSVYTAYEQARRDAEGSEDIPAVFHRRNRKPWLVVMSIEDWAKIYQMYISRRE